MILGLIVMVSIWMGVLFNLLPYILPIPILKELPMWVISVIWFMVAIGLVCGRAMSTGYWKFIDFPIKGQVKDFHIDKINLIPQVLLRSKIEGLLRTPDGTKFYRDRKSKATLFSAGHEVRLTKDGVNHTLSPDDLVLTQRLYEMGVHNIREMEGKIYEEMINLKEWVEILGDDGKPILNADGTKTQKVLFTLSGTEKPAENIDIDNNPWHKHVFDELAKRWSWVLADGEVITVFQYNEFQRNLARSDDMASAIDYVKTTEAGKALRIKKKAGSGWLVWVIIAVVAIALICIAAFFLTGGKIPGMGGLTG